LEKAIDRAHRTRAGECEDEPLAPILQCIADEHRSYSEEPEGRQSIQGVSSDQRFAAELRANAASSFCDIQNDAQPDCDKFSSSATIGRSEHCSALVWTALAAAVPQGAASYSPVCRSDR
jgi:hypothetical protein